VKKEIRIEMMNQRKSLNDLDKKKLDTKIIESIRNDRDYQTSKIVAIYYPMQDEINLLELTNDDKIFVIPKVKTNEIHFYLYQKNEKLIQSKFGVMEPLESKIMDDSIDYMIVPALAVSKDLYRIGYGKGFYDRFLNRNRPKHVVGAIYDFQEVSSFQTNEFDQKLDRYIKVSL
jgi:5-formyltetrahydrofolate cyclo-ligase